MKISDVTTHVLGTPWRDLTHVQVHTDDGLVGVGETRMLNHTQALLGYLREATKNHVLGSDPFDIESLVQRMKYGDYSRAGEIVMSGIACVEMPCWDIVGKALGQRCGDCTVARCGTGSRRTPTAGTRWNALPMGSTPLLGASSTAATRP